MSNPNSPALVIVSGPPASGKSTIARELARELSLPLFQKDAFKELLADELHVAGFAWSTTLGAASFEILFHIAENQLVAGSSVLIEGNFSGPRSETRFRQIVYRTAARTIQVNVRAEGELVVRRYEEREAQGTRHPIHVDRPLSQREEFRSGLLRGELPPLDISGEVIHVDTTDFGTVNVSRIAAQIRDRMSRGAVDALGRH